jgi:hypothetical protein
MTTITIRNEPNNVLTCFPCSLCHGATEKQDYLFHLPNGGIVCDECARSPEAIPARLRAAADQLRERMLAEIDRLNAAAAHVYVTEVVPIPEDLRGIDESGWQSGWGYSEDDWPDWMRERLHSPVRAV